MIEQHGSHLSPEQLIRHIDTLPLDSPDLHYLYNYHFSMFNTDAAGQNSLLSKAQEKYGEENVRVSLAMEDGKHVPIPETYGIYVDAKRWAELNPVQESPQVPTPSV